MLCQELLCKLVKISLSFLFIFLTHNVSALEGFPEDPNKKYVLEACLACHGSTYIEYQRLSRKEWDKTLSWMEREQSLKIRSKEVREKILDYLGKYFSPKKVKKESPMGLRPVNILPLD